MAVRRKQTSGPEYVSLLTAATELGIATKTVLARCVAGELTGKEFAGRIWVERVSLDRLKNQETRDYVA